MTQLVANDPLVALLSQAKALAEVRGPSGKVIGYYVPASLPNAEQQAQLAARIDPA